MRHTIYDDRYRQNPQYWEFRPSSMLFRALELLPVDPRKSKALDIGCGEGANAVFLARNGYEVTAFDLSPVAIHKTQEQASRAGVSVKAFQADLNDFKLNETYDLIFSSGTLQYLIPERRELFVENLKIHTAPGGLNVHQVFVAKPFVPRAHDAEDCEALWEPGEILMRYKDWRTEHFIEEIKPCNSGGVPHEHAHNRLWSRKPHS